ncbi:leucyl aminopeptidase [Polymorphobacter fuscus]|uniref:Probable cytosol aminopeptidase n=1 Tax=Sandarakinorhabdus fusca TaxID=1439888 RepID=A0A7C9KH89_9SPHN|nr:leucyl aminopeptidase [Polymorphobacter fuscus]KAB7648718.1 leucyl aminopeptidase [Polymorphobacter fuscus]MQT16281.1 leucyl aminopeptidase [Polymorphobacter fuscus]
MLNLGYPDTPAADPHAQVVLAGPDMILSAAAAAADTASEGRLKLALSTARFEGDAGAVVEIIGAAGIAATRLLVIGMGPGEKADAAVFEKIGGAIAARLLTSGETRVSIDLSGITAALPLANAAAHLGHGAMLRSYRFDKYRTTMKAKAKPTLDQLDILGVSGAQVAQAELTAIAAGVERTRNLVSEPANIIYPESFVESARDLADLGIELTVLGEPEMQALGMGALLGVSQGSRRAPRLMAMRWNGTGSPDARPVVLVGKGVTFDTGGISIKPAAGMEDMKWDMGGAGAVTGAMHALAARKSKSHVIGVVGLVENMPDGNAQRPGDVVTSMNGQTIEVINTDAEGRLVLCDAIWWAQEQYDPEVVVDLATLTGAIIVSLGHEYGGLFCNDDGLAMQLQKAGETSGEKLWRMPLGDAFDSLIDSPIADMKNVGPRNGGSITAAQFIKRFVKPGVKWAHLDIAGMVWADKAGTLFDKGATGYGVRLLDRFIAENHEA